MDKKSPPSAPLLWLNVEPCSRFWIKMKMSRDLIMAFQYIVCFVLSLSKKWLAALGYVRSLWVVWPFLGSAALGCSLIHCCIQRSRLQWWLEVRLSSSVLPWEHCRFFSFRSFHNLKTYMGLAWIILNKHSNLQPVEWIASISLLFQDLY